MVEPNFQGVNRFFVLTFENDTQRASHTDPYLINVEIKNYNVTINGDNIFYEPIKNNKVTYENIRKICIGSGDDYTVSSLLSYPYLAATYKMIAVDLNKQQILDSDPRAVQKISFTANLDRAGNTRI